MYDILNGRTCLVTGAAGFIGSHLCERLLGLGCRVIAVDNLSTGRIENLAASQVHSRFICIKADVNRFDEVALVFGSEPIDYVFHLAALVGVKNVIERPLEVFKDIDGTKFLLALAHAQKVKKVVYVSSSEAYGEPISLPEREDGHLNPSPRDPYGLTKLIGESMVYYYFKKYGMPGCSLRFFNVYGPRQSSSAYGFVAGIFIEKVLRGEPMVIFGDGTATRDFIYIDDNIEGIIRSMVSDLTHGEVLNIGSGLQTTIRDLATRVMRIAGREVPIINQPPREMEIKYRCPDITKLHRLTGFTPAVGLREGLSRTLEWYLATPEQRHVVSAPSLPASQAERRVA